MAYTITYFLILCFLKPISSFFYLLVQESDHKDQAMLFFFLSTLSPHGDQCSGKIYKYKNKRGEWCFTNDPSLVPDLDKAEEMSSRQAVPPC
jgi:hypothetical protein